jgi:hypothetical protein
LRIVALAGLSVFALLAGGSTPGNGAAPITVAFESHGAFFSKETHQRAATDPHVFIKVTGAASGAGPQEIVHAAGLTPAPLEDPAATPLFTADGRPLKITLGQWLGASGTVTIGGTIGGKEQVTASFKGLVVRGSYSLFEVTFKPSGNTFAPLDGAGTANNFVATDQGAGNLTVTIPAKLSHANAVLLVYHSDGQAHAMLQGAPGLTAHHQLIARVP